MLGMMLLVFLSSVNAGTPLWTFNPLTTTTITVPQNASAIVQYRVTNQSKRTHTLQYLSIQGITQNTTGINFCGSNFVLAPQESCVLSLTVTGSSLTHNVTDGPIVCQNGNPNQCYRPSSEHILRITQGPPVTIVTLNEITPNTGPVAGGTGVTLSGAELTGATSITFGGVSATNVNVINATSVTAVTPANPIGSVDVTITTPNGSATLPSAYTYQANTIGQSTGGGVIACLSGGLNDLIATQVDNATDIRWGPGGVLIGPGAQSPNDGYTNTTTIVGCLTNGVSPCAGGEPINTYAAGVCSSYQIDSQGNAPCQPGNRCYKDWFLPATNQLKCLYTNEVAIGGFSNSDGYWSSVEVNATQANTLDFLNAGLTVPLLKIINLDVNVRCVRSFTP